MNLLNRFFTFITLGLFIITACYWSNSFSKNINQGQETYIMGGIIGRFDVTLGIFSVKDGNPELIKSLEYKTKEISNFADFLQTVLDEIKDTFAITIRDGCFGVPGNTEPDRMVIQSPHLSFAVDGYELMQRGLLDTVAVINDFEVQGYGIESINSENIIQINKGIEVAHAPKMIIGAGAGLGSAFMVWDNQNQSYGVLPLGACFMDFAPQTQQELDFAQFLNKRTGQNATWGKILGASGGIVVMYDYISGHESSSLLTPDAIFDHYFTDQLCKKAVDFYISFYAQAIRTMIYAVLPHGGVYITNTLAANYCFLLTNPAFFEEILNCHNDWFIPMLQKIPVHVVTDKDISLYGAASYVTSKLESSL